MMVLPIEWNVEIQALIFNFLFILSFNSFVAFLVKETISIRSGSICFISTRYFTFASIVVVLPAPAPATTRV